MRLYFVIMILFFGVFVSMYGWGKVDTNTIIYLFERTAHGIWATSELKRKGYDYSAGKLWDGKTDTFWATRINGGVGEEIVMFFWGYDSLEGKWIRDIGIVNGCGKNKDLFLKNNRAKEIRLKLYKGYFGGVLDERCPRGATLVNPEAEKPLIDLIYQTNLVLRDKYLYTNRCYFPIDFGKEKKENFHLIYVLVITINSVYKGSKEDVLCISEIAFLF